MRSIKTLAGLIAMSLVAAACADGEALADAPETPTTTPSTTMVEQQPGSGYADVDEREGAPMVTLSSGERVTLWQNFDHTRFGDSTSIDNPWLPMMPGTRMVFEGFTSEDGEVIPHRLVFTVTDLVKVIDGIRSVVLWDVDYSDGELVETELAFFAQDDAGNVWRMGEYPEEWEEGEFIDAPAWIAGIADARAGIAMPATPRLGAPSYSQGWGPEVDFSDRAYLWEEDLDDCVAEGCYSGVIVTNEFNDDEPGANQLKYYARGVGNIRVGWRGDESSIEELELVDIIQLTQAELEEVRDAALLLEERAYILKPDVYGPTERATQRG